DPLALYAHASNCVNPALVPGAPFRTHAHSCARVRVLCGLCPAIGGNCKHLTQTSPHLGCWGVSSCETGADPRGAIRSRHRFASGTPGARRLGKHLVRETAWTR